MDKTRATLNTIRQNIAKEYGSKGLAALAVTPEKATPWQTMTASEITVTEADPIGMHALAAQL